MNDQEIEDLQGCRIIISGFLKGYPFIQINTGRIIFLDDFEYKKQVIEKMEIMKTRKFRKKPIVVEAVLFDGTDDALNRVKIFTGHSLNHYLFGFFISTPDGEMRLNEGDWVIRGVKGEFYPCKPDVFKLTYDEVKK